MRRPEDPLQPEDSTMKPTTMTPEQAREKLDAGERLTFLDARSPKPWDASDVKLPGAIRVPPAEVEHHLGAIPREGTVVTYCT
jgi:rhodanese-related sulfurtransferase